LKSFLFILLQHLLPQKLLSRSAGLLADSKIPWLKNWLIGLFIRRFDVDLSESKIEKIEEFPTFNAFFCRELKTGLRTWHDDPNGIISPVDGAISQMGKITAGKIFQAKGRYFSLQALLGGNSTLAKVFNDGTFATIYLSPKDYHRIHMPVAGTLKQMIHVPGALFSVNPTTTENVDALFARNERVVCVFDTAAGPMILVFVGAMIVASIETPWAGLVAPAGKQVQRIHYGQQEDISLAKGQECGRFRLGSTVVVLFPKKTIKWSQELNENKSVKLGQTIAKISITSADK